MQDAGPPSAPKTQSVVLSSAGQDGGPARAAGAGYVSPALLRPEWAVRSCGFTVVAIGGVYFLAWMTGIAGGWSAAGVITMKTNMSVALVLGGTALLLSEKVSKARLIASTLSSTVVLATGLLTLSEHLLGVDLGIDQLLATEPPGAIATTSPNRFGIPGSVSLTLLGAGLLARSTWRHLAPYFGLATLTITLVPAVGFLYRVGIFYSEARVTAIAWPTVVALSTIALGLMLSKPGSGPAPLLWRDDPGGVLLRRLWLPVVVVPLVVGALRAEGERRGLYDRSTGDGAASIALIVFFSALLWRSAAKLSATATLHRRAEEALRGALAHAQSLGRFPEENPDPVLRLSGDFTVLYANGAALRGLGKIGLALGRTAPEQLARAAARAFSTGQPTTSEIACGAAVFSMTTVPVGSEVNAYGQEITARKQAEEALREASERKNEFLSMLSHELRNPLAGIRSSVYVLHHADPAGEQAERARGIIERQSEHLTRIVDDLLDVTRIERGKILLHRDRVDLRDLVSRAVEDIQHAVEERQVTMDVSLPDSRLWIDADATRMTQVVGNLLNNATKFTQAGGSVTISLREVDATAEISVRDTGAGIDPELLPSIFDPFVQGERTLARSAGGLGLGLALVKGLVELHGGCVEARSAGVGRGAEFIVRLPLLGPLVNEQTRFPPARRAAVTLNVLVIDDNADAAESLADLVALFGHRVEIAYDGPSAIEKARRRRPDVVLCDIGLPGMTGYDVAKALRSEHDGSLRLVALSGYAQAEDVEKATAAGFDAHVAKPADPGEIERLLA